MNAQEYIASGLLEAYVAGALSADERIDVEAAIARYHEVAAEVTAIEETMWRLAESSAVPPPPDLQEDIWNALQAGPVKKKTRVLPVSGNTSTVSRFSYAQAAMIALLVGSLALNFFFWNKSKNNNADSTLALQKRIDSMQQHEQALTATVSNYRQKIEMMADPAMKPIVLQTTQKDHPMSAMMYWSKEKKQGYIAINKMPLPPAGKQYQLWALVDGKPVSLGVLSNTEVGKEGLIKITEAIPDGQAFAISMEKEGGSPTPTMEQIFVMGKVSS